MVNISSDKMRKVEEFLQPFRLTPGKLESVSTRLLKDMLLGLANTTNSTASTPVKMLPALVGQPPDENGDFLSLDVGGTNLRIMLVQVKDGVPTVNKENEEEIPEEKKRGSGEEFFDYIADALGTFLEKKLPKMPGLGFIFSFPCRHIALDKGILIKWTKEFSCSGVEGQDVVQLLKDAIRRQGKFDISSVAMVNDTVGTLMSCGKTDSPFDIGVVIGTGTNACYMGDEGCINTEWGGFGDDGSLRDIQTEFDLAVDCYSGNPGMNTFEKMTSGRYLGEVARLVLVKMTTKELLFNGIIPKELLKPYGFKAEFMSNIERKDVGYVKKILKLSEEQIHNEIDDTIIQVCEAISTRSAQLCGAALVSIANLIKKKEITVAVDGSVYRSYTHFSRRLEDTVKVLAMAPERTFKFERKSSAIGAAMVVAAENRKKKEENK
ncbi:hexokinase-2-like [Sardina pilchardus]|uniref:hexokinase-2-like n=1 Tax=Sardina pilchardus TaxID=27697 RepID=UPI002E11BF46